MNASSEHGKRRTRRRAGLVGLAVATMTITSAAVPATMSSGTAAPPGSTLSCGSKVAKSTGGFWRCTFADDFSGSTLDTGKWSPMLTANTGVVTPECRVASDNNITVQNGALQLTVRRESAPLTCSTPTGAYVTEYTGGAVTTYNKFAQAYGRYEIRARFPDAKVQGLHSAIWMWPQSMKYGDASGEIDIAEFRTSLPDRVTPYVHYKMDSADTSVTNNYCMLTRPEDFHSYVLEWTTSTITVSYDGTPCMTTSWHPAAPLVKPAPFDQPFAMILNQGLGINGNTVDPSVTPLPSSMYVDYVRAWS
jgi:beta-glucanase (GH16 family)